MNGKLRASAPKTEHERNAHVSEFEIFKNFNGALDEIKFFNKVLTA